ncbi:MAG: glycosyltransferase 87 family protein [Actinomycetota bacterium]
MGPAPVFLSTWAALCFVERRDRAAGFLAGLGVAAKLYPVFVCVAFVLDRFRTGSRRAAGTITGWALAAVLIVNLPVAIVVPSAWSLFFRFNTTRPPSPGSIWFGGCGRTGTVACVSDDVVGALSLAAFLVVSGFVFVAKRRREPEFAGWTLAFPLLVAFVLTSKVYSPQYTLWLLPWFALVFPDVRTWAALAVTDVAVHLSELSWLGEQSGFGGASSTTLRAAVILRAAALIWCLVRWVRMPAQPVAVRRRSLSPRSELLGSTG